VPRWKIDYEGEVYREGDLTLDQIEQVEELTKTTWLHIAPLRSAKHAKSILAVCIAHRKGVPLDAALATAGALTADQFFDVLTSESDEEQMELPSEYEGGLPKAAAE
jgi:hypothetical protein